MLIITCPCALGLAVPIVQVIAARRLFESGIMVKDGSALERLAEIDGVALDKTGTLTLGRPSLVNANEIAPSEMRIALGMTMGSRHPAAQAIAEAAARRVDQVPGFDQIEELAGLGLQARRGDDTYRLGRQEWAMEQPARDDAPAAASVSVLARNGELLAAFVLEDRVRPDAREAVDDMRRQGLRVEILSGDRVSVVEELATKLGIRDFAAGLLPAEKVARVAAQEAAGRKVLMVGDGLNDAPALIGRPCVHGSRHRGRHRPQCRGFRVPERKPVRSWRRAQDLAPVAAVDIPELRFGGRLQCPRGACRRVGLRDAPRRGGRDVVSSIIVVANAMRLSTARKVT